MVHRKLIGAVASAVLAAGFFAPATRAAKLELDKGAHISIVGNTLGERMGHDGWLESTIQSRFPTHQLSFRNLCEAADQVDLRIRVEGFGTPDEWLANEKTDVVFAFFGFNESFHGPAGLDKFKKQLDTYVKHVLAGKFSDKGATKIVLFSPIAQEKINDPHLPDNVANNKNIAIYSKAIEEVATENKVPYVDLFTTTQGLYSKASKPLTIDCLHLTKEGDQQVAKVIGDSLFGEAAAPASVDKLRNMVMEKDELFFWRYQTNDGYNVYGGRSKEKYANVTNRVVFAREMEVLDAQAANRDRAIWDIAQGKEAKVDDSNTPPFIPTPTNAPGPNPDGTYPYPSPEDELKQMKIAPHFKIELVASEREYPDLENPVQMMFDPKGRLWVSAVPSYPHWKPKDEMNDKILIYDIKDGKAVKQTVFADHLNMPTGLAMWNGGMIVATAPDLWYLKDTTGGDHANYKERIVQGLGIADTHHQVNSFVFDPGGALYMQEGTFMATHVETAEGPNYVFNGGVFRYEPLAHKFETYVSFGFANPHGHVWDQWGQDFVTDGTGNVNYWGTAFSSHVDPEDYKHKHTKYQPYFRQRYRPCPGTMIVSSRAFPESMQGNLLDLDVIQLQGIGQYKFQDQGSGFKGVETNADGTVHTGAGNPVPIVTSKDPNFRPVSAAVGPDGAIYFLDWQNPLIGHLQHHLRDPNRGHTHGRIWRITYEGKQLLTPPTIAGAPVDDLLKLLAAPEDNTRYLAKVELSSRDRKEVLTALPKWIASLDKDSTRYQHNLLEALWTYQWIGEVNEPLLKQMLRSPDFHARAAATKVLCAWRGSVADALPLLRVQATDDHPRVRIEAVRACSFFTTSEAADVALESLKKSPQDFYLKYVLDETMNTLDKYNKK